MNRFPLWKNGLILLALLLGLVYTLPNFYGQSPAVQVSPLSANAKPDDALRAQVASILVGANLTAQGSSVEPSGVRIRFQDTDTQLKARDLLDQSLNVNPAQADFVVALNLVPNAPQWLQSIGALPMYLGLDLSGGVHFLLEVDMKAAVNKRIEAMVGDIRGQLREARVFYTGVSRDGNRVLAKFQEVKERDAARALLAKSLPDVLLREEGSGQDLVLSATLRPEAYKTIQEAALKQNILALRNRVNELGAKEPIIQQQGEDRIIVQLPGVQDTAKAKEIIGRTASLEIRLVDEDHPGPAVAGEPLPFGDELVMERRGIPVYVKKQVVLTGEVITDASAGFDSQSSRPSVNISMDGKGARVIKQVSRENLKKRMAILLIEKSKTEAISVATIQDELGARFQITGLSSPKEANDLALLLRAGALAAPMEFLEERTVGPSLGKENIARGFHSTWIGFTAIALFMGVYYMLFGVISVIALAINVLFLVGLLSLLQATLTLPGMAGIALTVGMAIDANVLINERIREELRGGNSPGASIVAGYERAFATIFDSNVTTGIAGLALFAFGSGPVKGFAVVLVLGILTSMFSAVLVSRALVNLIYGRQRRIEALSIGYTAWKEDGSNRS